MREYPIPSGLSIFTYIKLEGQEGKTFYAYSSIIPEVRWSAKKIKVSFNKTDSNIIAICSYQKVE